MEIDGVYPNIREYVLDEIVPYCDGVHEMKQAPK